MRFISKLSVATVTHIKTLFKMQEEGSLTATWLALLVGYQTMGSNSSRTNIQGVKVIEENVKPLP